MNRWDLGSTRLTIKRGNLAEEPADAVVLGVKPEVKPAGPSTGAIAQSGGEDLVEAAINENPVEPSEVVSFMGGSLVADEVFFVALEPFHQVEQPDQYLRQGINNALTLAREKGLENVAFQPLGYADFDYPLDRAARVLFKTLRESTGNSNPRDVSLVLYEVHDFYSYQSRAEEYLD